MTTLARSNVIRSSAVFLTLTMCGQSYAQEYHRIEIIHEASHEGAAVKYSSDGNTLIVGTSNEVVRIDVNTEQRKDKFVIHDQVGRRFSSDGRTLASTNRVTEKNILSGEVVNIWNTETGQLRVTLNNTGCRSSGVLSPDGRTFACMGDSLKVWDTHTGRLSRIIKSKAGLGEFGEAAFSSYGLVVYLDSLTLGLWNNDKYDSHFKIKLESNFVLSDSMASSPDGNLIAIGGISDIAIIDVMKGRIVNILKGHTDSVTSLAFSRDGRYLVSGSGNNWLSMFSDEPRNRKHELKLWDVTNGKEIGTLNLNTSGVYSVDVAPNDKSVAFESEGINIWDVSSFLSITDSVIDLTSLNQPNPKDAVAYNNRGIAYAEKGDYAYAIADFDQAIQLDPKVAKTYYNRGKTYAKKGDYARAIADYDQAIRLDPKYVAAFYNRGNSYDEKGDHDRAIADYDQAIRFDPKDAKFYSNRGKAYAEKGDYERAITDYDQAIRLDSKHVVAYYGRGNSYDEKGDHDRAITDYDQAILLDPNYVPARNNRGRAYLEKGDYDRAIADYDQVILLDPKHAVAYYGRGMAYEKLNRLSAALADFQNFVLLSPNDTDGTAAVARVQTLIDQSSRASAPVPTTSASPATSPLAIINKKRVALVIGNANYRFVAHLRTPTNEADVIGKALKTAGIEDVTVDYDLSHEGVSTALKTFEKKADTADWAVIYYAGHGIEIDGVNYLVPIDAKFDSDRDVPDEAISLDRVQNSVRGARELKLIVLNACRTNPFALRMKRNGVSRGTISSGLGEFDPIGGTLVVYAAKAGTVSYDGEGDSSPFALSFAKRIVTPGVEIDRIFRFIRQDVLFSTNNQQEPFVYGSLPPEEFYFIPPK